jgi:KDO2-lipid IV(A) lauroyltransferase
MSASRKPFFFYITPATWPTWIGLGLLRIVCWLPHRMALGVGSALGRLAFLAGGKRRAIVQRNIELCFPELSPADQEDLVRRHFASLGISFVEMGLGRWATDRHLNSITTIEGLDNVQAALDTGKGVILLGAHFTTLEISGRVVKDIIPPFYAVYRKLRSEFATEMMLKGRQRSVAGTIEKRDIKQMVRRLREGSIVWYAPDQSYNRKGSEVVPFFGVPSMHNTATSTLARLGKAEVVPFVSQRLDNGHYRISFLPRFEDFPTDDAVTDTMRYVHVLEEQIRQAPEQYFWVHRKFKNLPDGYPDYYADLTASK